MSADHTQAKKAVRADLVTRLFVVALLVGFAFVVVWVSQIRTTQLEGTPLGKKIAAASDRILDCTDSDGDCTKKNQEQTAEAVGEIGTGNILAVVCALQVPNGTPLNDALEQVTQCVADRLSKPKP